MFADGKGGGREKGENVGDGAAFRWGREGGTLNLCGKTIFCQVMEKGRVSVSCFATANVRYTYPDSVSKVQLEPPGNKEISRSCNNYQGEVEEPLFPQ